MRYFSLLPVLLLMVGCQSGPSKGDYYEHMGTQERIKVDSTGLCGPLFDYYDERLRRAGDLLFQNDTMSSERKRELLVKNPAPKSSFQDSTRLCASYTEARKDVSIEGVSFMRIRPASDFAEDFRRVE